MTFRSAQRLRLSLVLALAAAFPLASTAQQAVVVAEQGTALHALGELGHDDLSGARAVWAWGPGSAPHRFAPDELPTELRLASESFSVVLPEERGREAWVLVAAPSEMWLEVPEALLPRWPIPQRGPVRVPTFGDAWTLRLLAGERGSWWVERSASEPRVELVPLTAVDREISIVGPQGEAVAHGSSSVLLGESGTDRSRMVALQEIQEGLLRLPSLPDVAEVTLVVGASGAASRLWTSRPSAFPSRLGLEAGTELVGRFVDADGEPIADVEVAVEGWLAGEAAVEFGLEATSDQKGGFLFSGLPPMVAMLTARGKRWVEESWELELTGGRLELGEIVLSVGSSLDVRVVDDLGAAIAGAQVEVGSVRTVTDRRGLARLAGLNPRGKSKVRLRAAGHLKAEAEVSPQEADDDEPRLLRLQRATTALGRVVGADGTPASEATIRVIDGNRFDDHPAMPSGMFEISLAPGRNHSLVFRTPTSGQVQRPLAAGKPGEVFDLGDVELPAGIAFTGRLWSSQTGLPLPLARLWLPRPGPQGEVLAYLKGDLIESRSDSEGRFVLRGLPRLPATLRIDAAQHARLFLDLTPPESGEEVADLGDVWIDVGATVLVVGEPTEEPLLARIDPRGDWLEADMLTAPMVGGEARFQHVPAGSPLLTVLGDREVLCEERLSLAVADDVAVDCVDTGVQVSGTVLLGGRVAGAGRLSWRREDDASIPGVIVTRSTRSGAERQSVLGAGRPDLDVEVDDGGRFFAERISPGSWTVSWVPVQGSFSASQTVEVPGSDVFGLELSFADSAVTGTTLDGEGLPLAGARVSVVGSDVFALSDRQGRFQLSGLGLGIHRVYAARAGLRSDESVVEVEADRSPRPLRLVVADDDAGRLVVQVADVDGGPRPGALVLLTSDAGDAVSRVLTTDLEGRVETVLPPPWPERLRAAAWSEGEWTFSGWRVVAEGGHLELLAGGRTGGLVLRTEEPAPAQGASLPPALYAEGVGDVAVLMAAIGRPLDLQPGRATSLAGLPAGTYWLAVGDRSRPVVVRSGEVTEVEIP